MEKLKKQKTLTIHYETRRYALTNEFIKYYKNNCSDEEWKSIYCSGYIRDIMALAGWEMFRKPCPDTLFDTPVFPKIKLNRFPLIQPAQPQQAKPVVVYTGRKILVNLKTHKIIREI